MKWIVLSILVCIVPYTWINLHFRKPNPAFLPYQDTKDRAQVMRLLNAGFRRVELSLLREIDPSVPRPDSVTTEALPGGLPQILRDVLIDPAPVPSTFPRVDAAAAVLAGSPYEITATCTQPEQNEAPAVSALYLRGEEAIFVIGYDALPGELQTRRLEQIVRIVVPANTFTTGTYHATLIGARESRRWTFEVL